MRPLEAQPHLPAYADLRLSTAAIEASGPATMTNEFDPQGSQLRAPWDFEGVGSSLRADPANNVVAPDSWRKIAALVLSAGLEPDAALCAATFRGTTDLSVTLARQRFVVDLLALTQEQLGSLFDRCLLLCRCFEGTTSQRIQAEGPGILRALVESHAQQAPILRKFLLQAEQAWPAQLRGDPTTLDALDALFLNAKRIPDAQFQPALQILETIILATQMAQAVLEHDWRPVTFDDSRALQLDIPALSNDRLSLPGLNFRVEPAYRKTVIPVASDQYPLAEVLFVVQNIAQAWGFLPHSNQSVSELSEPRPGPNLGYYEQICLLTPQASGRQASAFQQECSATALALQEVDSKRVLLLAAAGLFASTSSTDALALQQALALRLEDSPASTLIMASDSSCLLRFAGNYFGWSMQLIEDGSGVSARPVPKGAPQCAPKLQQVDDALSSFEAFVASSQSGREAKSLAPPSPAAVPSGRPMNATPLLTGLSAEFAIREFSGELYHYENSEVRTEQRRYSAQPREVLTALSREFGSGAAPERFFVGIKNAQLCPELRAEIAEAQVALQRLTHAYYQLGTNALLELGLRNTLQLEESPQLALERSAALAALLRQLGHLPSEATCRSLESRTARRGEEDWPLEPSESFQTSPNAAALDFSLWLESRPGISAFQLGNDPLISELIKSCGEYTWKEQGWHLCAYAAKSQPTQSLRSVDQLLAHSGHETLAESWAQAKAEVCQVLQVTEPQLLSASALSLPLARYQSMLASDPALQRLTALQQDIAAWIDQNAALTCYGLLALRQLHGIHHNYQVSNSAARVEERMQQADELVCTPDPAFDEVRMNGTLGAATRVRLAATWEALEQLDLRMTELRRSLDPSKDSVRGSAFDFIEGDAFEIERAIVQRVNREFEATRLGYAKFLEKTSDMLESIAAYAAVGEFVDSHPFVVSSKGHTASLTIEGLWNPTRTDDSRPHTLQLHEAKFLAVESPNGSGKSFLLDEIALAALFDACLQHVPARPGSRALLPTFDRIIHLGRALTRAQEASNIRTLETALNGAQQPLIILDEPGSRLPEAVRPEFILRLGRALEQLPGLVVFASHDHQAVDAMVQAGLAVQRVHLSHSVRAGTLEYGRQIVPGPAPSLAIEVAKACGLDVALVKQAQALRRE
jgi:hypothetical protein